MQAIALVLVVVFGVAAGRLHRARRKQQTEVVRLRPQGGPRWERGKR